MNNHRITTLLLILVFLISALMVWNSKLEQERLAVKDQVKQENPLVNLASDLKESLKTEGEIVNEPGVSELLDYQNRDAARIFLEEDSGKKERLKAAALKLFEELAECAAADDQCGARTKEWEDYFGVGAPPLHNALLRALAVIEHSGANVDQDLLVGLMKAPSFGLSYAAASLALDRVRDSSERLEILEGSRALQNKARALFLEKYAADKSNVDEAFVEQLSWSVNASADDYTRAEVLSRIERFNLNEEQFRFVSFQACQGSADDSVVDLLDRKSKAAGFTLSKNQLCSLPDEDAED